MGSASIMSMTRTIQPMKTADGQKILFWTCSECSWAFIPAGTPHVSDSTAHDQAHDAFKKHDCAELGAKTELDVPLGRRP